MFNDAILENMNPALVNDNPLVQAFYAQRNEFRHARHIEEWFHKNIHLLPGIPEHLPEQRVVEYKEMGWILTHKALACDKTSAELSVKVSSPKTDDDDFSYTVYSFDQTFELDFSDWPYLTAGAIACHVVATDSHDETTYLPVIDATIAKYQPVHFPNGTLKSLHALKDSGLLCVADDQGGKALDVVELLFESHRLTIKDALPECVFE